MLSRFGTPADGDFVAFATWIDGSLEGKRRDRRCWWSPQFTAWLRFPSETYDYIDFQQSGPASPLEGKFDFSSGVIDVSEDAKVYSLKSEFNYGDKGQLLYYAVRDTYRRFQVSHPAAAWSVYTGNWREMRPKGQTTPSSSPTGPRLTEFEKRVAEIKDLYKRQVITDEQQDQMILELLREYF